MPESQPAALNWLEFLPDAALVVDEHGAITHTNAQAETLFGYTRAELIGKTVESLVPEHFRARHVRRHSDFFAMPRARPMTTLLDVYACRKDGIEFPVNIALSPLDTATGKQALAIVSDITARKQAEEALAASEARYRNFYENVHDIVYRTDYNGLLTDVSPSSEKHSGYRREEVIGQSVEKFFFDPQDYVALNVAMARNGTVNDFEIRLKHKDGRSVPASITSRIILDSSGQPIATEGVLRDITARKQAEESLHKSEEHYRSLVEAIPDLIFHLDAQGRFIDFKSLRREDLYVPPEVFLGKRYDEVLPPSVSQQFAACIETARQTGQAQTFEYPLTLPDQGTQYFETRLVVTKEGRIVCVPRNITERKQAEEALAVSEAKESCKNIFRVLNNETERRVK